MTGPAHTARVGRRLQLAAQAWLFELEPESAYPFEQVAPGAHIDVELPGGLVRQYSLLTHLAEQPRRLVIAVKRDDLGRGGSRQLCDAVAPGARLAIGAPRNHFALHADDAPAVLFAGGIGITPIWSMVQALRQRATPWTLHYAARSRADALLLERLAGDPQVHLHFDDACEGRPMAIARLVQQAAPQAHLYCCGPAAMLDAFEAACSEREPSQVHLERFSAVLPAAPATGTACVLRLARTGLELKMEAGASILETLRAAGVDVASSCEQGICGACETAVLEGEIEHRDSILGPSERAAGQVMMVCCSLGKGERLVLDL
ncbi:PDR/VanB family oxidoreductase [Variovorax boronicumulans]|uniref:PDR/VanB family oxidoreductase n=1 Tax=Variovorax boronicumulans TaxID=436515 RepID=UPI001C57D3B2